MKVIVVLDPDSPNLSAWLQEFPVWVVESPSTRAFATEYWRSPKEELTLFKVGDIGAREENCLAEITTIEEHHPGREFLLVGLEETQSLRRGLAQLGYRLQKLGPDLLATKTSN